MLKFFTVFSTALFAKSPYIDHTVVLQLVKQAKSSNLAVLLELPTCNYCNIWAPRVAALHDSVKFPLIRVNCLNDQNFCSKNFAFHNFPSLVLISGQNVQVLPGEKFPAFVQNFPHSLSPFFGPSTSQLKTPHAYSLNLGTDARRQYVASEKTDTSHVSDENQRQSIDKNQTDTKIFMLILVVCGAMLAISLAFVWYYRFSR